MSEAPRDDGRLQEMLLELRVLLQGAQMLTAFLIIVPFSTSFRELDITERSLYAATFGCAVLALVLFTAPATHHRLTRPLRDRAGFKTFATRMLLAGAAALSVAWTLASKLVFNEVLGRSAGTVAAVLVGGGIFAAWWAVPFAYRRRWARPERSTPEGS